MIHADGRMKQGMASVEIQVDRGTGFVFLAIDTIPNYTDTAPMPAAGQSVFWKYKAIYRQCKRLEQVSNDLQSRFAWRVIFWAVFWFSLTLGFGICIGHYWIR